MAVVTEKINHIFALGEAENDLVISPEYSVWIDVGGFVLYIEQGHGAVVVEAYNAPYNDANAPLQTVTLGAKS